MNCLLSVIIPLYNKEMFIEKCINSVLISEKDIEVIVVDDGSKDNSLKIALDIAKNHSNINVITKKNGGVSSARNMGLAAATGKYIFFLDADDYVDSQIFRKFLNDMKSCEDDLILLPYYKIIDENRLLVEQKVKNDNIETLYLSIINQEQNEVCTKIYSNKLIQENKLSFSEKMRVGEDLCFFLDFLNYCNSYSISSHAFYCYYINDYSVCSNVSLDFINQEVKLFDRFNEFISILPNNKEEYKLVNEIKFLHKITIITSKLIQKGILKEEITSELEKNNVFEILRDVKFRKIVDKIRKRLLISKKYKTIKFILNLFRG